MKNELAYFTIQKSFGGDQRWFRRPFMRIGGCGAATACDSLIALNLSPQGDPSLQMPALPTVPRPPLTKKQYCAFVGRMRPYLYPRLSGIDRLDLYMDGFAKYLRDAGIGHLSMAPLSGEAPLRTALCTVCRQIDGGLPIPFLLLKHKDAEMKNFTWHWFLIIGYEGTCESAPEDFHIITATYGKRHRLSLPLLWDTGYEEKGGMVIYTSSASPAMICP